MAKNCKHLNIDHIDKEWELSFNLYLIKAHEGWRNILSLVTGGITGHDIKTPSIFLYEDGQSLHVKSSIWSKTDHFNKEKVDGCKLNKKIYKEFR